MAMEGTVGTIIAVYFIISIIYSWYFNYKQAKVSDTTKEMLNELIKIRKAIENE